LKEIILGTSGHIDHGKTSLIKALTGVDTDRLEEEKRRGITIELGFASLTLPNGQRLGIVDVPGHEKFVKNMVAGAAGIDIVAMVIAADEGIMPQTEEHMEICTLLGVTHGIVVLTKTDLVDEEWHELVIEEISNFTEGTFLENSPVIPVSSVTGEGLENLLSVLENISQKIPERTYLNRFRLPIDRVFTMKGFGTVITGTIIAGSIEVGDSVSIYPPEIFSKVRGIQVHNKSVEKAKAGMRCAINFQGLEKALLKRGYVVAERGFLKPGYMMDIDFTYLKSAGKPLRNGSKVRFHTGTGETMGSLILPDAKELLPGKSCIAQLRLYAPATAIKDDRFVIRSYSPVKTIGGGSILNPIAKKSGKASKKSFENLKNILAKEPDHLLMLRIKESGTEGISFAGLIIMTNLSGRKLDTILQKLLSARKVVCIDKEKKIYIHSDTLQNLIEKAKLYIESYHKQNPLKAGMQKDELKSKIFFHIKEGLFNLLVNIMLKEKIIALNENILRLASHNISLKKEQKENKKNITEKYKESGLTPPYFKDVVKNFGIDEKEAKELFALLVKEKMLVKVKQDLYFDFEAIENLQTKLIDFFKTEKELTTPQFKKIAKVSRKYLIPLLEYFDSSNITIRVGDVRQLRKL